MRKSIVCVVAMCLLLLTVITVNVRASTTQSFTAMATLAPSGSPAKAWTDEDGVVHVRGLPIAGSITGELTGSVTGSANSNVDSSGNGDGFGSFTLTTTVGTWQGRFSETFTGGVASGNFIGQGSGGLEGEKIMGSFAQTSTTTYALQGTILNPQG